MSFADIEKKQIIDTTESENSLSAFITQENDFGGFGGLSKVPEEESQLYSSAKPKSKFAS